MLRPIAVPLMLLAFVVAGLAMAATPLRSRRLDWSMARSLPRPLFVLLLSLTPLAVANVVSSFAVSDGLSQHERSSDPECEWPIGDRLRTVCVSHERWLRTGDVFVQAFLGIAGIVLLTEAGVLHALSDPHAD